MSDLSDDKAAQLEKWTREREGQVVLRSGSDKGDCWNLPYEGLRAVGASTPCPSGNACYNWGRAIALKDVKKGDVMQVDGGKVFIPLKDGRKIEFSHHSCIILGWDGTYLTAAHQWEGQAVFIVEMKMAEKSGPGRLTFFRTQQP